MCEEHLKKFDITRDNRDKVALVLSFKLRRTELSKAFKNLMTYNRKNSKSYLVITILLALVKNTSR